MKKITAFFMAILPFFVTVLLFVSGLIIKDTTHVSVSAVQFDHETLSIQKPNDDVNPTDELVASVLPKNATNQNVKTASANTDIATVEGSTVTAINYGETYIYGQSEENPEKTAACKVEVWDDKVHELKVDNAFEIGYLPYYGTAKINAVTVPATHIVKDPQISYKVKEGDESKVRVSPDGEITCISDEALGTQEAEITVYCAGEESKAAKPATVKVKVGGGVKYIELQDPSAIVSVDTTFDLKNQIKTYPDSLPTDEEKKTELRFETSDENIATVSDLGKVEFKTPGTVTITIRNARNKDIFTTKTITSTSNKLLDVNFNRYSYTADISKYQLDNEISESDINWTVYPASDNQKDIKIESSNTNVIEVVTEDNKPKLKAKKPGTAILTASLKIDETTTKTSECYVTITSQPTAEGTIFKAGSKEDAPLEITSRYLNLQTNVDFTKIFKSQYNVANWSKEDPNNIATLENGIVYFKKDGTIRLDYKLGDITYKCYVESTVSPIELSDEDIDATKTTRKSMKVGQQYKFTGDYEAKESWDNFDVFQDDEENWNIIPKKGGSYDLCIKEGGLFTESVYLYASVEEPLIDIQLQGKFVGDYYATTETTLKMRDTLNPTTYPSTASTEAGLIYNDSIKYTLDIKDDVASWNEEDKTLIFKKAGTVGATFSIDGQEVTKTCGITSSNHVAGRFGLTYTDVSNEEKEVYSGGSPVTFLPGESKTLKVSNLINGVVSNASDFKLTKVTDSGVTEAKVDTEDSNVVIKVTADNTNYGQETYLITTPSYSFYLNVKVDISFQNFYISYRGKSISMLSDNVTYIKDLVLDVIVLPITLDDKAFSAKFNNEDITIAAGSNKIDLKQIADDKWKEGANTLAVTYKTVTKEYTITYKSTIDDFNLYEADDLNNIYIKANATSAITSIYLGGFVNEEVYKKFTLKVTEEGKEPKIIEPTINKFAITDIIDPATNPEYNAKLELIYTPTSGDPSIKEYKLSREIVSKVVFPYNDNLNQNDAKGLQKVHVYGDKTFDTPEEGLVDYYKLYIDLYDYEYKQFTGENKTKAFNSLIKTISNGNSYKYNEKGGFVEIHFDKNNQYTVKEIYDNAFDTLTGKNVLFAAHTHNYSTYAQYIFVPVAGVNVKCQEGLKYVGDSQTDLAAILQTNFGLEDTTKDNTKFDDYTINWIPTIYGNGYTFSLATIEALSREKSIGNSEIYTYNIFNTTMQGGKSNVDTQALGSENYPTAMKQLESCTDPHYYAYNEWFKWRNPTQTNDRAKQPVYVKSSLFHDCAQTALTVGGDNHFLYVEDVILFNAANTGIACTKGGTLKVKGILDIYNFKGPEMFYDYLDKTLASTVFRDVLVPIADECKTIHITPSGQQVVNSTIANALGHVWFYTGTKETEDGYIEPGARETVPGYHLFSYAGLKLKSWRLNIWGTKVKEVDPGAPDYYDEYKTDGSGIRTDFIPKLIEKLTRTPTYF